MNIVIILALCAVLGFAGVSAYFVARKILGVAGVTVMMVLVFGIVGVCVRAKSWIVLAGLNMLLCIIVGLCLILELSMPSNKPSRKRKKRKNDEEDDGDEYISTAQTMTVREIVNEYTKNPAEAERVYTNTPLNVIGRVTKITNGEKHSHVELEGVFMCVCPQGSVRSLSTGVRVSITGTLRGKYLLDDCLMVKYPV
ncbi:MAG: hypothetical protein IJR85_10405 [Synergistaceae bacterium]|nr:hypothetical protein [Synergistaceae bacterium]